MRYKRISYNLNVMRQSACLVINPITVDDRGSTDYLLLLQIFSGVV